MIYSQNLNAKKLPASLSKIISLMVIWDKIVSDDIDIYHHKVCVPIVLLGGNSTYYQLFEQDEMVEMVKLLQASLVVSSNEAIYALAVWHSGSEQAFVEAMNRKSAEIGLKDSVFASASGVVRKGHTTAQDMLTMAAYFIRQYPILSDFASAKEFSHRNKTLPNTNRLIHNHSQVLGLKTGNLVGLGANLINYFEKGGKRYISVVLMAKSRAECFDVSERLMENLTA